ncbi:MAG: Ferredoxin-dependent glutamate synthase 1 [Phycisphaerae bacterium]|nr:Ferredoxin-dependent glutamate synthase 1 [Phycisphaerae bacterium]
MSRQFGYRHSPLNASLLDPDPVGHDACGIGAVVNISGRREHRILEMGNQVLMNLQHRGASGSDEITGDGAGILIQIPHEFFAAEVDRLGPGIALPRPEHYGVAMVFLPRDRELAARCCDLLAQAVQYHDMVALGWRDVPGDPSCLGELARSAEPLVRQLFIDGRGTAGDGLERKLYLARRRAERLVREQFGDQAVDFYVTSMSCRTLVYKGMFLAPQLFGYYPDLHDERMVSALALVHQRYSTNTFPNWRLAQPFRMVAHNGEINTLSGNANRMRSREMHMSSPLFGKDIADVTPVLQPGGSDSAQFDNTLELLVMAGRSLPHAMMMMIPEAFGTNYHISTDKRAFYEYHATIMEPWDGPAAMVFTDGRVVGGTLDRNGLRPCRYIITTDDVAVLSSEVGVIDLPPERIRTKGRLQPGRMFLVDAGVGAGRIITDNEVKSKVARQRPYRRWLEENRIELRGLFSSSAPTAPDPAATVQRLRAFGYTREELRMILAPMARDGQEPVGSMGNDTPLAVLSDRPKPLFAYFKQLFAQVTNPPIDPLREGLVMSLMSYTGKERNLLDETPQHCRQLKLSQPILTNDDIHRLRTAQVKDLRVATIPAVFDAVPTNRGEALRRGLERLADAAESAVRGGATMLIISDRDISPTKAPIPSLLAVGAVHRGLLDKRLRSEVGLIVESGEPREVMHFCLLVGFGAKAINPYLAFEALHKLQADGDLAADLDPGVLADHYVAAIKKGILKTMSKMGISTIRSYHGAQLFEAIGLDRSVVDAYFRNCRSRIGGVGLAEIAEESLAHHKRAFADTVPGQLDLDHGGEYQERLDGERHLWNHQTVTLLQRAVSQDDAASYREYAGLINDQSRKLATLRGLFEIKPAGQPVPIEEVEPAEEIVKRFRTGAMSLGSISREAHETLAIAMNRLGGRSNTGEGGEADYRYEPMPNGDSMNSAIKQVASARFGVTINYLAHAQELQIKMAQGAKPGEGGQLPGHKVSEEIARLRHSTPGVTLISPPPHHDIYSIEDLAQLIYDLKCSNPGVKVSVKLVSEVGVGTVAAGVAKGNADEVLISGHDGGTGASPLSSIKHAGTPWELGLAEAQQILVLNGLRDRIRVQVDGQLKTGRDVLIGALLGAETFGFGTSALVSVGCILMRKCHLGTCPVGVATQNPKLRAKFAGDPKYLQRFMLFIAREVREAMAALGVRRFEDLVGRSDLLAVRPAVDHWKARGLDMSAILARPDTSDGRAIRQIREQPDRLADHLDWELMRMVEPAIEHARPVRVEVSIRNVHRTVGAIMSNRIAKKYGPAGLPDGTVRIGFCGSAGQSFGAFLAPGVTLHLIGDSNDYLGKGLSGGRIVVETPDGSPFEAHDNIIVGNTLLYGATSGECFINGLAGERFAVRNSGAVAVVEGVGDHGCEYMTGGTVVVLGRTGRNFAAGMSGGIAYVLDEFQLFDTVCNLDMVDLESVWQKEDQRQLRDLIARHHRWTGSKRARHVLDLWDEMVGKFVKVIPIDYRAAVERMRAAENRSDEMTPATEEVYTGA